MSPTLAIFNATDCGRANSIFLRNDTLQSGVSANIINLFFSKFGCCASLSSVRRSVLNTVKLIVSRCIPAQIFKSIVHWIAVVVASLHAFWAQANKRLKNGFVRVNGFHFVVFPKTYKWPSFLFVVGKNLQFAGFAASNSTHVGYVIQTFVTNNRNPVFHGIPHMLHMGNIAGGMV